jgi:hypothetical protein
MKCAMTEQVTNVPQMLRPYHGYQSESYQIAMRVSGLPRYLAAWCLRIGVELRAPAEGRGGAPAARSLPSLSRRIWPNPAAGRCAPPSRSRRSPPNRPLDWLPPPLEHSRPLDCVFTIYRTSVLLSLYVKGLHRRE